jgi:hypothetical protein
MPSHTNMLTAMLALSALLACAQSTVSSRDNSDWWSALRTIESDEDSSVKTQSREPAASNFRILGITLGDDAFVKAKKRLGEAAEIHRGDAALGRNQLCYVSTSAAEKIHLIFEQGEVNFSYYLFVGGPDWNGSESCVPSKLVTKHTAPASGLHLGQSPAQVLAILGKPSLRRKDELIYSFMVEKKNSPESLEVVRKSKPGISEEDLHKNYDSYTLGVDIDAKFKANRLIYLAVSKSETY